MNNATRWPGYGRTSGMRCVIARAEPSQQMRRDRAGSGKPVRSERRLSHPWPLGPRRPWRGTLSSSDRLPCALSLFIADRFSVPVVYQQRRSRNGKHLPDVKRREHMPVAKHYGPPTKTPGAFLNDATRWHGYERTSGMRCVLKTPGAFLNNATRWPGYGRTSGMRCVIARAEPSQQMRRDRAGSGPVTDDHLT